MVQIKLQGVGIFPFVIKRVGIPAPHAQPNRRHKISLLLFVVSEVVVVVVVVPEEATPSPPHTPSPPPGLDEVVIIIEEVEEEDAKQSASKITIFDPLIRCSFR